MKIISDINWHISLSLQAWLYMRKISYLYAMKIGVTVVMVMIYVCLCLNFTPLFFTIRRAELGIIVRAYDHGREGVRDYNHTRYTCIGLPIPKFIYRTAFSKIHTKSPICGSYTQRYLSEKMQDFTDLPKSQRRHHLLLPSLIGTKRYVSRWGRTTLFRLFGDIHPRKRLLPYFLNEIIVCGNFDFE